MLSLLGNLFVPQISHLWNVIRVSTSCGCSKNNMGEMHGKCWEVHLAIQCLINVCCYCYYSKHSYSNKTCFNLSTTISSAYLTVESLFWATFIDVHCIQNRNVFEMIQTNLVLAQLEIITKYLVFLYPLCHFMFAHTTNFFFLVNSLPPALTLNK